MAGQIRTGAVNAPGTATEFGVVKWFSVEKMYGFITPDAGGLDLFVHRNDVKTRLFPSEGQRVSYVLGQDSSGRKCATNVKVL